MLRHRLPLLVTGVAGVAGFNAFHYLHQKYPGQVVGIRPHQTWKLTGAGILGQDTDDADSMAQLFARFGFQSILNCNGNCALKSCELDPRMAHVVNVESAIVLADLAKRHDARLVHLSSDLVFSGNFPPLPPPEAPGVREHFSPLPPGEGSGVRVGYLETDPTDPVTVYGKTMVQAEDVCLTQTPAAAILRISLPMGPSFNRHAGAIDWIQSRFKAQRPATLYFDEVRSCTYCDDLNAVFEKFLTSDASGVFHCGGPRPITLYEIAQVVNRVGDYDPRLLKGCPRIDAGPMPPRAGNVSMSSAKLIAALGGQPFRPWPFGEDVMPTDRHWHHDRPVDEPRSLEQIGRRLYRYPEVQVIS